MRREISKQPVEQRIRNFSEVALGYTHEEAGIEAKRCLGCPEPLCVNGCPVGIAIPSFIKFIQNGQPNDALKKIKEKNNLPAVCGRVCPQENQCETACILNKKSYPINIGALERYAADYGSVVNSSRQGGIPLYLTGRTGQQSVVSKKESQAKIAVVGSGPAGLTCAADLAKMGYQISLFESLHLAGGVLIYGIPEFRLPKQIVQAEVEYIKNLGVNIVTDTLIGTTYTIQDLFKDGFIAVFIASGAGLGQLLGIQGENLNRVYSANEFLTRINLMKAYKFPEYATPVSIGKSAAVIGGGNVAVDCARAALRLGSRVSLVYRRGEKEMPARLEEIENAKEEGVMFEFLTQPVRIIGDEKGFVKTLECVKMELGEPDETGRKRPIPVKNSCFSMDIDTIIVAIGQNPNPLLPRLTPGLKTNNDGTICVDKNLMTSIEGVFGGGDIITGADTVISAMAAGKKGAVEIDNYVREHRMG